MQVLLTGNRGSRKHTLMEVAREDCFLPSRQKIHLSDKIDDYLSLFKSNKAEGKNYIHEVLTSD